MAQTMRIAASSGVRVSAMLPTGPLLIACDGPKASHNCLCSHRHGSTYIAIGAEPVVCVSVTLQRQRTAVPYSSAYWRAPCSMSGWYMCVT